MEFARLGQTVRFGRRWQLAKALGEGFLAKALGEGFLAKALGEGVLAKALGEGFLAKALGKGFLAKALGKGFSQRRKGAKIQKCTDAEMQRYRDTERAMGVDGGAIRTLPSTTTRGQWSR
jgi:hypothetical protein